MMVIWTSRAALAVALSAVGAAAAQAADEEGGLPQLDPASWPSQIIWLTITLFALYVILTRIAAPRIEATLEERRDTIVADLDLAADFDQKAKDAEAAYKAALEEAQSEARKIADKTRAEIQTKLAAALQEAETRIAAKAAESAERLKEIEAQAKSSAAAVAGEVAEALVDRFSPSAVDPSQISSEVSAQISARFGG